MNGAVHVRTTRSLAAKHLPLSGARRRTATVTRRVRLRCSTSGSPPASDKERKSQELQAKARQLRQQQEELARQLAELNEESQELSDQEQKLVQAELSGQDEEQSSDQVIPEPIRNLLNKAGVLDAVPWDGPATGSEPADSYFGNPEGRQDYDVDLDADDDDDDDDVFEGPEPPPDLQDILYPDPEWSNDDQASDDDASDDEAGFPEDEEHFEPGEGVEEMLRMLEAGGTLPDIEGLIAAEDPQEFQMRIKKLVDRYEDTYRKKKDRKLSTEELQEMEKEEAWEPTDRVPIIDEDITEIRPAPSLPDEIQQQYDTLQHCCYLLRRAHLSGKPDEPVKALASAGLVDMQHVQYDDPLICSRGLQPWLQYMEALRMAGAWTQAEHVWAEVSDDRPNPEYTIYVDQFVNLPYPQWYYRFLLDNADAYGAKSGTGLIDEIETHDIIAVHESYPEDPSIPIQRSEPAPPAKKFWFENMGTKPVDLAKFAASQASRDRQTWGTVSDQELYRQLAAETVDTGSSNQSDSAQAGASAKAAGRAAPTNAAPGSVHVSADSGTGHDAAWDSATRSQAGRTVNRAGETVTKPESLMLARLRSLQGVALQDEELQSSMRRMVANKRFTGSPVYLGTDNALLPRTLIAEDLVDKAAEDAEEEKKQRQRQQQREESTIVVDIEFSDNEDEGPEMQAAERQSNERQSNLKSKVFSGGVAGPAAEAVDKTAGFPDSGALPSIDLLAQFDNAQKSSLDNAAYSGTVSEAQAGSLQATAPPSDFMPNIDLLSQFGSAQQGSSQGPPNASAATQPEASTSQGDEHGPAFLPNVDLLGQFSQGQDDDYGPAFLPSMDLLTQFNEGQQDNAGKPADSDKPADAGPQERPQDDPSPTPSGEPPPIIDLDAFTDSSVEGTWKEMQDDKAEATIQSGMHVKPTDSKYDASTEPKAGATDNPHIKSQIKSEQESEFKRYNQMKKEGFANGRVYFDATVNLDGAQVLTPEGWQRVTPMSEPGDAWEKGNCMTLCTSTVYELNATSGKIVRVTCGWGSVNARAWTLQNVLDVYIQCAKLGDL